MNVRAALLLVALLATACGSERPALPGPVASAPRAGIAQPEGAVPFDDRATRAPMSARDGDTEEPRDAAASGDAAHAGGVRVDGIEEPAAARHAGGTQAAETEMRAAVRAADGRDHADAPDAPEDPEAPNAADTVAEAVAEGVQRGDVDDATHGVAEEVADSEPAGETPAAVEVDPVDAAEAERAAVEADAARALQEALAQSTAEGDAAGAAVPAADHAHLDAILRAVVREERIDYETLRAFHYERLVAYLRTLAEVDASALPRAERLAFFINLYNATMMRAVCDRINADWTPAAEGFRVFDDPLVELAGARVSLNHLEHEIIRKQFQEPRIHVALVCAARSCPPLRDRAYRAADLEAVLEENMRAFLASGYRNRIDRRAHRLYLSRLFDWYADDFGGADQVAAYVDRYVEGDVADYEVEFIEYHWDLNSIP